ncbi:hypothetical protein BDW72DRAFT_184592 [Aspergillus terricola var. indicus]
MEDAAQHRPIPTGLLSTCLVILLLRRLRRKCQARLTAASTHNLATAAAMQQQGKLERLVGLRAAVCFLLVYLQMHSVR